MEIYRFPRISTDFYGGQCKKVEKYSKYDFFSYFKTKWWEYEAHVVINVTDKIPMPNGRRIYIKLATYDRC